jgi:hypothetical protein
MILPPETTDDDAMVTLVRVRFDLLNLYPPSGVRMSYESLLDAGR